jgi:hypothetical protein
VGKIKSQKHSDHDSPEGLDLFDDEVIQPKKDEGITENVIKIIIDSWNKVAKLGVEKVGIVLFKNIFKIAPGAL